jgi:predicted acylesterase/phospholipase RssA
LPIPFGAVATDLQRGRTVWLREGSVIEAVRASCAMPGLFPPRRYADRWLVDGGLVDPVPVTLCRMLGAELVIAVNLSAYRHRAWPGRVRPGRVRGRVRPSRVRPTAGCTCGRGDGRVRDGADARSARRAARRRPTSTGCSSSCRTCSARLMNLASPHCST